MECFLAVVAAVGLVSLAAGAKVSSERSGRTVTLASGKKVFLSCTGEDHGGPTVILATGRGIGDHTGWSVVEADVAPFARVCSYDLGVGDGDDSAVDDLVPEMHELFEKAKLPKPYVMVGASLGGVLVRRYETRYLEDVAGFVFVDSAHEEMEWRDASIAPAFDTDWNDGGKLRSNGLLADGKLWFWKDDVPLIVLERGEKAPCSSMPDLTKAQCDGINDEWHRLQVDLSKRSKYGELRTVAGAGHTMVASKPEVVAQAVKDVLGEIGKK